MHFLHLLLLVYVQLMQNGYGYPEHKLGSQVKEVVMWTAGQGGYHTYRIPALVVTPRGHVLAFCEGRKNGPTDAGDIDWSVNPPTMVAPGQPPPCYGMIKTTPVVTRRLSPTTSLVSFGY